MLLSFATALGKARKALASRHLFDNWLSLMTRYALHRLGFDVKLTAKIRGCTFEISPETFERLVSRFSHGLIKSVVCINGRMLVNGMEVKDLDDVIYNTETWARVLGWAYDPVGRFWFKGDLKFRHMYGTILEIFDYGAYKSLSVKDKVVVDVGAFVGDSAIYFALKGAKRVIAIEPHPGAYAEMLENIRLNNLEGVIIPLNAGLAGKPGRIRAESVDKEETIGTFHRFSDVGSVKAVTLDDIVGKFGIREGAVLKMDCEGCEYEVLSAVKPETLRVFDQILIEYHNGYRLLRAILENYGFSTVIKPMERGEPIDRQGYIIAVSARYRKRQKARVTRRKPWKAG
jgi:FkbM family methyltransferase